MIPEINETHDPKLESWVRSANETGTDFPVQNLPLGVFKRRGADEEPRVGVAIGDYILDVAACRSEGLFKGRAFAAALSCEVASLNSLMALGPRAWGDLRRRVSELLRAGHPQADRNRRTIEKTLVPMAACEMRMPVSIGDFTDFHGSTDHAASVRDLLLPDAPPHANYRHVPIAYHGRASSVVVSGTPVRRPNGQIGHDGGGAAPVFGASASLDYEVEVGFFVGPGNPQGTPVAITDAERHVFGLCLVNDWSARDIHKWEHQPLGPFLGKSFATTVSPWVVTLEALAPYRVPAAPRPDGDAEPLPHLDSAQNRTHGGIDVTLEVRVSSQRMRDASVEPVRVSRGKFRGMNWTVAQMLSHHTSNGCNVRPGDLMASGAVSGRSPDSRGSLLGLSERGSRPLRLPGGEERSFLEDGDEVIISGACDRDGFAHVGFGDCRGVIVPAL